MKRTISFLLTLALLFAACTALAENEQTQQDGYSFEELFERSIQSVVFLQGPNGGARAFMWTRTHC